MHKSRINLKWPVGPSIRLIFISNDRLHPRAAGGVMQSAVNYTDPGDGFSEEEEDAKKKI